MLINLTIWKEAMSSHPYLYLVKYRVAFSDPYIVQHVQSFYIAFCKASSPPDPTVMLINLTVWKEAMSSHPYLVKYSVAFTELYIVQTRAGPLDSIPLGIVSTRPHSHADQLHNKQRRYVQSHLPGGIF